ncbi:hypothetical protein WJX82_000468 [Trebouxia sp. C0006]
MRPVLHLAQQQHRPQRPKAQALALLLRHVLKITASSQQARRFQQPLLLWHHQGPIFRQQASCIVSSSWYAEQMVVILDASGLLFKGRIIAQGDAGGDPVKGFFKGL